MTTNTVLKTLEGRLRAVLTRGPDHRDRLRDIDTRIVVSGTRGKSGTTRRLHDIFHERGYDTAAKITGNHPVVLHNGDRYPIERGPKVTLYENEREIREHTPEDVLIVENQGITEYTNRVLSDLYVDPHVLVITNVRQDHLDTLGGDREGVARSLVRSIPDGTHLVNGEQNPEFRRYLEETLSGTDVEITHVEVPAIHTGIPGAETVYAMAEVVRLVDEPLSADRLETYLDEMRVSWTKLPNGRVYNAAQVNDVESTEAVRQSLQSDHEEPLTVFMYVRGDRRARTASFLRYLNGLADAGIVEEIHVAGSHTQVFKHKATVPVVEHDESAVSAGTVLSEMLDADRPVFIVGNTVAEFVRDMEDEINNRRVYPEPGRDSTDVDDWVDLGPEGPLYLPQAGSAKPGGGEYAEMPAWAVHQAAITLDVCSPDAVTPPTATDDDEDAVLGFPDPETYNSALEAIEAAGLDHGREYLDIVPDALTYDVDTDGSADLELRLVPIRGTAIDVILLRNDQREHIERTDRGFWDDGAEREALVRRLAGALAETDRDQDVLERSLKDTLVDVRLDAETASFDDAMRSPRERELRERTVDVVRRSTETGTEWVVTLTPGSDSPVQDQRSITVTTDEITDPTADAFQAMYLDTFFTTLSIDPVEWSNLTDYWVTIAAEEGTEHAVETAADDFIDWATSLDVPDNPERARTDGGSGLYVEDYENGTDAVLILDEEVANWKHAADIDEDVLARVLQEKDVLLRPPRPEVIAGEQRRVWPVSASALQKVRVGAK